MVAHGRLSTCTSLYTIPLLQYQQVSQGSIWTLLAGTGIVCHHAQCAYTRGSETSRSCICYKDHWWVARIRMYTLRTHSNLALGRRPPEGSHRQASWTSSCHG